MGGNGRYRLRNPQLDLLTLMIRLSEGGCSGCLDIPLLERTDMVRALEAVEIWNVGVYDEVFWKGSLERRTKRPDGLGHADCVNHMRKEMGRHDPRSSESQERSRSFKRGGCGCC